jgi:alkyl hydroperoxide reductase subunit AhpC
VDFGYICPTELMVVEDKLHEFQQEECEVLAISTGSIMSKVALMSLEKDKGGVAGIKFVPPEGKEGQIGSMYGVMKEDSGYSNRAMVLINKEGVLVPRILSNPPIGSEKEESNEEVKYTIKDIPEKTVKTDNIC